MGIADSVADKRAGFILVFLIIGFSLLLFIISHGLTTPEHPLADLVGLWRSDSDYLLVVDADEAKVFTTIDELRDKKWAWSGRSRIVSDDRGQTVARLHFSRNNNLHEDILKVSLITDKELFLAKKTKVTGGIIEKLSSHIKLRFHWGILYPDGLYEILSIYSGFCLLFVYFLNRAKCKRSSRRKRKGKKQPIINKHRLQLAILFSALLFSPTILAYLLSTFLRYLHGFWDPLLAGNISIVAALLIPAAAALYVNQTSPDAIFKWMFYLFAVFDFAIKLASLL